ncbi:hypothetical protein KCP69_15550 [Salmonella enterica subsp. enterica]|nr:hypothetical protein KCP69_15550 [Salmonella enterica subsp. enterica]
MAAQLGVAKYETRLSSATGPGSIMLPRGKTRFLAASGIQFMPRRIPVRPAQFTFTTFTTITVLPARRQFDLHQTFALNMALMSV